MAEGKGKAAILLLLLVGGGAAAVAISKSASADPGPAKGCRWALRDNGTIQPGEFFAMAFDAPANWTDADVATFKYSMASLGFDQQQHAEGAPVLSPYGGARGVSFQGRYVGSRPYNVPSALKGIAVALLVLVNCPQPGIAPPPAPKPDPLKGSYPEHYPALPGDHMAAGCDPLPAFPAGVTANDVSDDDPRSPGYPTVGFAQLASQVAQGMALPPGITPRMLPPGDPRSAFYGARGGPAPDPYRPHVEPIDAAGPGGMFAATRGAVGKRNVFPRRRRY